MREGWSRKSGEILIRQNPRKEGKNNYGEGKVVESGRRSRSKSFSDAETGFSTNKVAKSEIYCMLILYQSKKYVSYAFYFFKYNENEGTQLKNFY